MLFKPSLFLSKPGLLIAGQRLWQALAGVGIMLLITTKLDSNEQGWYYTFVSLASLCSVFEMGLSSAIQQVATAKFMGLEWNKEVLLGPRASEFSCLLVQSIKAYFFIAIVFIFIVYPLGIFMFTARAESVGISFNWFLPWSNLVIFTALGLLVLPFLATAEGSGRITEVYMVRLVQGVLGSLLCGTWLWFRSDLWATSMAALALILVTLIWLSVYQTTFRKMVSLYWSTPEHFDWSKELWPLQWRVGVSWVSVFAWSQLATPMIFFYRGALEAGQFGLTLAVAHMLGLFAQSWISRGIPSMARAALQRDWSELAKIFKIDLRGALATFVLFAIIALIFRIFFVIGTVYDYRILSPLYFGVLLLFVFFNLVNAALATHLRSFQHEPLMLIFLLGAVLSLTGSFFAVQYSVAGVIWVMVAVQVFVVFPLSYWTWKKSLTRLMVGS